jgi:hypothetical protein
MIQACVIVLLISLIILMLIAYAIAILNMDDSPTYWKKNGEFKPPPIDCENIFDDITESSEKALSVIKELESELQFRGIRSCPKQINKN